jgi:NAD(P)-dependent dehydrogenase (short-subunit alcohol dehydrogenase family)
MSLQEIKQAVDLNVTSKAWLTTRFLQHFDSSDDACQETTVVNISSMCAIKPTPTMALYCATSAARDIFHTVLALDLQATTDEEEGGASTTTIASPQARILNYAPGSCDTDMQAMLREHDSLDPAVHAYCQSLVEESNSNDVNAKNHNGTGLVKCEDTANELVRRVLEPGTFQSGDRVEYTNMSTYNY